MQQSGDILIILLSLEAEFSEAFLTKKIIFPVTLGERAKYTSGIFNIKITAVRGDPIYSQHGVQKNNT